jgi:hypothetical protein
VKAHNDRALEDIEGSQSCSETRTHESAFRCPVAKNLSLEILTWVQVVVRVLVHKKAFIC